MLQNVARSCRRLSSLLAKPQTSNTWGHITLSHDAIDTSIGLECFCSWLHRRATGELNAMADIASVHWMLWRSSMQQCQILVCNLCRHPIITYVDREVHAPEERYAECKAAARIWHLLVGATASTSVQLSIRSRYFASGLGLPASFIQPPLTAELSSRLTALDVEVAAISDYGLLAGLAALEHLRLGVARHSLQHDQLAFSPDAFQGQWDVRWTSLCTLWLDDALVPLSALFSERAVAALSQLQALRLDGIPKHRHLGEQPIEDGPPPGVFRIASLTRLDLDGMDSMTSVPDLTGLPNLRQLSFGRDSQLALSTAGQHIGGATGLTKVSLHGTPLRSQGCVDALCSLPALQLLYLDFWSDPAGIYWAAILKRRLGSSCFVTGNGRNRWAGVDHDCF